nr:MAG TPA: Replication initiator A family protein [Caudoviricetes sp.]
MSYINYLNDFWIKRSITPLTSTEADLYICLLDQSNVRSWENPFECRNDAICAKTTMSEKTLIDVRKRLEQKGFISVKAGERKKKSPIYTLLYLPIVSKNVSCKVSNSVGKNVGKNVSCDVNLYKSKSKSKKKENIKEKTTRFLPPTFDDVKAYCIERKNNIDPQRFIDFYTAKNWMIGKNKMKDWRAAVRTWEQRDNQKGGFYEKAKQSANGTNDSKAADRKAEIMRRASKAVTNGNI